MPICPRCAKCLCTQQALDYHLRKQKKCNPSFKCNNCSQIFFNTLELNLHQTECNLHVTKLARIIRNEPIQSGTRNHTRIIILTKSFVVLHSDGNDIVGSSYFDKIHENQRENLSDAIKQNTERFMTHKVYPDERIWISAFSHGDTYIISERTFIHRYQLHGFLTPPW